VRDLCCVSVRDKGEQCVDGAITFALLPPTQAAPAKPEDVTKWAQGGLSKCDEEKFIVADRPRDWRNRDYASSFKSKLAELLVDPKPRCIKVMGYFQNLPLCYSDAKALWTPPLFANFTEGPGDEDVSIYLRCVPRHYHFNNVEWYTTIMEGLRPFKKVWLFQAPECPNNIGNDPARDGPVAAVLRVLIERYNATKWPSAPEGSDGVTYLLSDLAGLARSKRLILPVSSWYVVGVLRGTSYVCACVFLCMICVKLLKSANLPLRTSSHTYTAAVYIYIYI